MTVSPPRPKGPPLNALRAFEAAARLGGFVAAAAELSVTPGAISQHIKVLEAWVGAPLFERRSQGVVLTALGRRAMSSFGSAFDALASAVRALKDGAPLQVITIAALPCVAQLWLSPRMPRIRAALPGCTLSIVALEKRPNLAREMFDLSLFLDAATGRATETVLCIDALYPVCSPQIAARLREVQDLADETRLADASWPDDWSQWAGQAAPLLPLLPPGPSYSLYSLAVDEAQNGAGVLMGHDALIGDRVRSGTLAAPFPDHVASGLSLNLEVPTGRKPQSPVARLVALLTGNAV